jgi:hypothetical protein
VQSNSFDGVATSATAFIKPDFDNFFIPSGDPDRWFGLIVNRGPFTPPLPLYRNWQTPLAAITNGGPKIGETIYASAFERDLPRTLFNPAFETETSGFPSLEEYVYRITKQPNVPGTSVDHQLHDDYESLSVTMQNDWYTEIEQYQGSPYQFTWKAFMCVNQAGTAITKPTGLSLSYASREDGVLQNGNLNTAHNTMFKNAATSWQQSAALGQTIRSAIGTFSANAQTAAYYLGDWELAWYSHIWGLLDVNGSCGAGESLQALTIMDSANASPITTKSLEIPEQLNLQDGGIDFQVNPIGITMGVSGAASRRNFNAALWGLTTIAATNSNPRTITYNLGGGSGTIPSQADVNEGTMNNSYTKM